MLSESLHDPDFKNDWRRTSARYRLFLYEEGQEEAGGEVACAEFEGVRTAGWGGIRLPPPTPRV